MRWIAAFVLVLAAAMANASVAFVDVTVLPMNRDVALTHQTVLVTDGRVRALGPAKRVKVPKNATRIDGRGMFLMPGLVDAHVHIESPEELRLYLSAGVTSVFNLHGSPTHLEWARQVEAGTLVGPAIVTTGPVLARSYTPEGAVREVDAQAAAGYDAVKIYNQVGAAEYGPLVGRAKSRGLLVVGHIPPKAGFDAVVRAGQSIVHAEELIYTALNATGDDSPAPPIDRSRIPGVVKALADAGVFVTPTLSMYRDILRQANDLNAYLQRPENALLSPWVRARIAPGTNRYENRYSAEQLRGMAEMLVVQRQLVRAMNDAGVPLLAGTDSTQIGPVGGFSMHEELTELVASGLSPFDAIRAATLNARRHLGSAKVGGVIEEGARADLLLLSADPRNDIANARRIEGVMAKGRWYDKGQLATMRDTLPVDYARSVRDLIILLEKDPRAFDAELQLIDPFGARFAGVMVEMARVDGAEKLRRRLRTLELSEENMNGLGYALLFAGYCSAAIEVFEENVARYPLSSNAADSLAEARARAGEEDRAVDGYWLALALDPGYANADFARGFLKEHKTTPP